MERENNKQSSTGRRTKALYFGLGVVTTVLTALVSAGGVGWYLSGLEDSRNVKDLEAKLESSGNEERWFVLEDLAMTLVDQDRLQDAEKRANELLELAQKNSTHWNYGNAFHKGHVALGRIELRRNNLEQANIHLSEAGRTPGSPQLDSFGPNMLLAKELLQQGERDAVLKYIIQCEDFWKSGFPRLKFWHREVYAGKIPDFGPNLRY